MLAGNGGTVVRGVPEALASFSVRPEGQRNGWQHSMTMTLSEFDKGGGDTAALDVVRLAERQLERAMLRMAQLIDDVEAGRFETMTEAKKTCDHLTGYVRLLMEERNKVDKLRKSAAGAAGGGALDLDAARDEIGRRLALLRDAGGD